MTGSSINFKPVMSANRAVLHASREVSPTYLLAENLSLGTICILDDESNVANTLAAKLALASRQALASKNFSPVWEGILNLPRPALNSKNFDAVEYKKHCVEITKSWIEEYEKATNHKVLRADIHLDEGHIDEASGEVLLNAHAHIISDKTNEKGKVFIIDKKQMRALQTLTAEVTGLARGKSSHETGRKHIHHDAYKAIAKANSKELDKVKASRNNFQKLFIADTPLINKLKEDIQTAESELSKKAARIARLTELKEGYKRDRAKLKASGVATQKEYQALKLKHETDLAKLSTIEAQAAKVPSLETQVIQQAAEIAQYQRDRDALKASGEAKQADYVALKKTHEAALAKLASAETQAAKVFGLEAKINQQTEAFDKLKTEAMNIITPLRTQVKTMEKQITQLTDEKAQLAKSLADPAPLISQSNKPEVRTPAQIPREAATTTLEAPKQVQEGIPSPTPSKTTREAFLAVWAGIKMATLNMIDGARLDAADGRLGLFSWLNRATGGRNQVLCEVPLNKVMPKIGEVFDSRAVPGKEKGGVGR